jgi:phage repressor protein C with HTH and peptisase S24 domain
MSNTTPHSSNRLHFIPEWMEVRGFTRKEIMEHTGADKSLVSRWFKGSLPSDQYLARLAELFGTEREGLFRRPTRGDESGHVAQPASEGANSLRDAVRQDHGAKQVPIYAATENGSGTSRIRFDPVEHHPAPPDLANVRGAYGVLIKDETMVPAFRPGDIAWVNPHKLPDRDSDVVLYQMAPEAEAEAIIKTLVSWTPQQWKLRQYQPPKEWGEPKDDWPICHRIVGKKSVR